MAPAAFAPARKPAPCSTRCCAPKAQRSQQSGAVQAAGLAAAILLAATPAHAGIVTTDKPKTRNFVTQDAPKAEQEERELPNPADRLKRSLPSAPSLPNAPSLPGLPSLPSLPSFGSGEGKGNDVAVSGEAAGEGIDPKGLWPVGLLGTAAVLFALPKIDPGFDKMYQTAWVKDSGAKGFGIGTEDVLKNKGGYVAPYYERQEKEPKKSDVKSRSVGKIPQKIPGTRTSLRKKGQFP